MVVLLLVTPRLPQVHIRPRGVIAVDQSAGVQASLRTGALADSSPAPPPNQGQRLVLHFTGSCELLAPRYVTRHASPGSLLTRGGASKAVRNPAGTRHLSSAPAAALRGGGGAAMHWRGARWSVVGAQTRLGSWRWACFGKQPYWAPERGAGVAGGGVGCAATVARIKGRGNSPFPSGAYFFRALE